MGVSAMLKISLWSHALLLLLTLASTIRAQQQGEPPLSAVFQVRQNILLVLTNATALLLMLLLY